MKKGLIASLIVLASLAISATGVASGLALYRASLEGEGTGTQNTQGEKGDKGDAGEAGKTAWSNTILPVIDGGYITPNSGSGFVGDTVVFTYHPKAAETLQFRVLDKDGNEVNDTDTDDKTFTTTMKEGGFVVGGFVGTTNNPYRIDEQKDFSFVSKHSNEDKVMEIEKDLTIDLNDYANSNNTFTAPFDNFKGTLDGNGNTVKVIGQDNGRYGALINHAEAGTVVKDLKLDVANKDGSNANFGLINSSNGDLTVSNVELGGKIKWNNPSGGIMLFQSSSIATGESYNVVFDNVKIFADILSNSNVGLFVGSPLAQATYAFYNCTFDGSIVAPTAYLLFGNSAGKNIVKAENININNFTLGEHASLKAFKTTPSLLTNNDAGVFQNKADIKNKLLKSFTGKATNEVIKKDSFGFSYSIDSTTNEFVINPVTDNKINGVAIDHYTVSLTEWIRAINPSSKAYSWTTVDIANRLSIKSNDGDSIKTGFYNITLSNFESDKTKGEEYLNDGFDMTKDDSKALKDDLEKNSSFISDDLHKDAVILGTFPKIGLIKDSDGKAQNYVFVDSKYNDQYPLMLNLGKKYGWSVTISAFDADGNLLSIATKK